MKQLTHGSLFSGIGGFELGASRTGIENVWSCELDTYCRKVLTKNFPLTIKYEDINELQNPPKVDIISGGFPCQDISINGKGEGINGERSGLWKQMFRICSEARPKYIIIENSPAITIRGLCTVLSDLAKIGYDAEWQCLSNSQFGFPHKRERIYIIAYPMRKRPQAMVQNGGSYESIFFKPQKAEKTDALLISEWIKHPGANRSHGNNDGIPNYMDAIKSLGNSVNPNIVEYLFDCIIKHSILN